MITLQQRASLDGRIRMMLAGGWITEEKALEFDAYIEAMSKRVEGGEITSGQMFEELKSGPHVDLVSLMAAFADRAESTDVGRKLSEIMATLNGEVTAVEARCPTCETKSKFRKSDWDRMKEQESTCYLGICTKCGEITMPTADGTLRAATEADFDPLTPEQMSHLLGVQSKVRRDAARKKAEKAESKP